YSIPRFPSTTQPVLYRLYVILYTFPMDQQLLNAAQITLSTCLKLQPHETLLIVDDDDSPHAVVEALYQTAKDIQSQVIRITMTPREFNGQELPEAIAQALKSVDVFLGPTSKSFSHTEARRQASKAGVRGATLPGVTEDMFRRLMSADYLQISQQARQLLTQINAAKSCHITAPNGTDVTLEIAHDFEPDDGILDQPGAFGNLPAGEVMGAPTNANGVIIVDIMGDIITQPTRIQVQDNHITKIESNESGQKFQALLDKAAAKDGNRNAFQVAELGIGLNPLAQITGNVLEDEKVINTCHIAFGDNSSYPGGSNQASIHLDGVILQPLINYF
ncbi:MAG: aminopeptidase, partial [Bdellovibrionales bacterium]|nr:aminopeptidase [Bdellovibrionales bacterium]